MKPFHSCAGLVTAVALLASGPKVEAFWRLPCRGRSGLARIDPLKNFGTVSEHVHVIHGGTNFGMSSTYDDLMASSGTSCEVSQDRSAYWTPALYFVGADGTTELVDQVGGMLAYYFLNGNNIQAFPQGFQMIAGDSRQRNFTWPVPDPPKSDWSGDQLSQNALSQKALGFNCLNYNASPEPSLFRHFLPDKSYLDANCIDGVRFELMFPSCWNGKDADSTNHKSHVAYPSLVMTGDCPEGFDTQLPGLFYETIWDTYAFKDKAGSFVISNGDPTGYGYHGDFIAAWDPKFLQSAIDTCTNLSGQVEDCPLFKDQLQSESDQQNQKITIPSELQSENYTGPMAGLPGNVPIQLGPGYASEIPQSSPPPATVAPASSAVNSISATASAESIPSYNQPTSYASLPTTIVAPIPPPSAPEASTVSTLYFTTGYQVNEVIVIEDVVTAPCTSTVTALPTDDAVTPTYRRRFQRHRRHHRDRLL